jgi:hypothetical protein
MMIVRRVKNLLSGVLCGRPLGAGASLWRQPTEDGASMEVVIAPDMQTPAKYGYRQMCSTRDGTSLFFSHSRSLYMRKQLENSAILRPFTFLPPPYTPGSVVSNLLVHWLRGSIEYRMMY